MRTGATCSPDLPKFLDPLEKGADLVMGCRMPSGGGTILPGAMPWKHRYIGNPVLSLIGRQLFRVKIRDFHCGLRAFRRETISQIKTHMPWHGIRDRVGCKGRSARFADRRNPHHAQTGHAQPTTSPAKLARRLATFAVHVAVQSKLAFHHPGDFVDGYRLYRFPPRVYCTARNW